jgi:putative transposase
LGYFFRCVIPKVFPYADKNQLMKLTKSKILEIIKRKNCGWSTYKLKKKYDISIRRINQIYSYYLQNEEPPAIGQRTGRPIRPMIKEEIELVKEAFAKYRVCASTLEKIIKRDNGIHIPHNHIHKIMINEGISIKLNKKHIRKKNWIRYERRHSLTAVHLDWYYAKWNETWVLPVIDDASRKMLALIECKSATTDASIEAMRRALNHGKIKQCITDHGTQFVKSTGIARFTKFLENQGIKHILCRIKHPQSNGKSEKFNDLYRIHRRAFETKEEFIKWYNEVRPHRSLKFNDLETPEQAFQRKMRKI